MGDFMSYFGIVLKKFSMFRFDSKFEFFIIFFPLLLKGVSSTKINYQLFFYLINRYEHSMVQ